MELTIPIPPDFGGLRRTKRPLNVIDNMKLHHETIKKDHFIIKIMSLKQFNIRVV